ncbi:MAG: 3-deoxy-D-manno-octulosonic acid transferase [Saprospiraceae bacterium]|nr:3-deoxy-D-manno-octulosonic acid transferase [Saprospiraceae bacterium]
MIRKLSSRVIFSLYSLLVSISSAGLIILARFNPKLAKMMAGRKHSIKILSALAKEQKLKPRIWFHFASLGEFEQGRQVIENIVAESPETEIYISFFSPSGYEVRKNYEKARLIFYLPADTTSNAKLIIQSIQPDAFVLTKYDFWWNMLRALEQRQVPVYLISGVFRKGQYFFHPLLTGFADILKLFRSIFTQDENSAELLRKLHYKNVQVAGDTRIDRVISIAEHAKIDPVIEQWATGQPTLVYGSVWTEDMKILGPFINGHPEFNHIIVPHDISPSNVRNITSSINSKFSVWSVSLKEDNHILIIDSIGMLNNLYKIAFTAYIGGGFGRGIHNILEAAVYGIPVFFGPNHQKFKEAHELIDLNVAFEVNSTEALEKKVAQIRDYFTGSEIRKQPKHILKRTEARAGL